MTTKPATPQIKVGDYVERINPQSRAESGIGGTVTRIYPEGIVELRNCGMWSISHIRNLKPVQKGQMRWRKHTD